MTILFAGGEEEGFDVTGVRPIFSTDITRYDSVFSKGALGLEGGGSISTSFAATSSFWVHCLNYINPGANNTGTLLQVVSGGTPLVRLHAYFDTDDDVLFEYWNGSMWVLIAQDPLQSATLEDVDLFVNFASSGEFTLYQDGVQVASFTGDTTVGDTSADEVAFSGVRSTSVGSHISQVLIKTNSTLSAHVETLHATANGASTDFAGDFTDINEEGLNDDLDFITGSSNGDEVTFVMEDPTTPSGYSIEGLAHTARMSRGSTGPQNAQFITRSNGVNFTSASVAGLGLGFQPFFTVREADPDTSAAWTDISVAAAQFGLKAIT